MSFVLSADTLDTSDNAASAVMPHTLMKTFVNVCSLSVTRWMAAEDACSWRTALHHLIFTVPLLQFNITDSAVSAVMLCYFTKTLVPLSRLTSQC